MAQRFAPLNEGRKDDNGKPRTDLLGPMSMMILGAVLGYGAERYGDNNWRRVDNLRQRYYGAALRHLFAWAMGERYDLESGLPHLGHAMASLMFLLEDESGR